VTKSETHKRKKGTNAQAWYFAMRESRLFIVILFAFSTSAAWCKDKESLRSLLRELRSADPKARIAALQEIGHRGAVRAADVRSAIPALVDLVQKDKDPAVRRAAASALGQVDPDPEVAVPVLIGALKDKAAPVRIAAAGALGLFGNAAKEAIPALQQLQTDKDKAVARAANMALRSIRAKR
jgi:HEAT repeat protein